MIHPTPILIPIPTQNATRKAIVIHLTPILIPIPTQNATRKPINTIHLIPILIPNATKKPQNMNPKVTLIKAKKVLVDLLAWEVLLTALKLKSFSILVS
jgi:hypothetical protein